MNIKLFFNTIAYLKFSQVIFQIRNRLIKPKFKLVENPTKTVSYVFNGFISKWQCYDDESISFLNISDKYLGWNNITHGMLWAYNLNYMDWLCQEEMDYETGSFWIDKFIEALPNNKIGLDPYPIALRGINWIKFFSKYQNQIDTSRLCKWNDCLYSQYVLLSKKLEYHLMGNHLLEDAFSLYIASVYFRDKEFYAISAKLLHKELNEQILPDGAHYEQSPMYHCILLDRLLDCYNFSMNNHQFDAQKVIDELLKAKAIMMLGHLESIIWNNGDIPILNDSAIGIAPTPIQIKQYAKRLGLEWHPILMKECGYRKLKNEYIEAIIDIGDIVASYQPGHSHADTFNYELRINEQPFIVDTGISTYDKTPRRQFERSTTAHNTVTVNEKDSSEVWSGFRVGRRASVNVLSETSHSITAVHNGFGKIRHKRTFSITKDSFIIDDIIGRSPQDAVSRIHFAPNIDVLSVNSFEIITTIGTIAIKGASSIKIKKGKVATSYNNLKSCTVAEIYFSSHLQYSITI